MKKYLIFMIMVFVSSLVMAQAAGGTISRTPPKQFHNKIRSEANSETLSPLDRKKIIEKILNNLVFVEGGSFIMGATVQIGTIDYSKSKPEHQVTVSSYYIGKYEVTQEEWQVIMGRNPSKFKGRKRPVENISWEDCQIFISKLNEITGKQFRLPTEAEWEFAARGGNKSKGYTYSGSNTPSDVAWYGANTTSIVGKKKPNELGIFDMSGNVWEWCQDWFEAYNITPQTDPKGPSSGTSRVCRSGCWSLRFVGCTVFNRSDQVPSYTGGSGAYGLRLALSIPSRGSIK